MQHLTILGEPCPACLNMSASIWTIWSFDGLILNCSMCGFDDFVLNPLSDKRMYSGMPSNWCLV